MHILVTADTVGGVWTYTRELVTGLARRGVRVTLVSFGGIPSAAQSAWLDGLPGVTYFPTGFRLEWMQDAETDLAESMRYLRSVIRECEARPAAPEPVLLRSAGRCAAQDRGGAQRCDELEPGGARCAAAGRLGASGIAAWLRRAGRSEPAGCAVALDAAIASKAATATQPNSRVIYNGRTPELFDPIGEHKQNYAASAGRLWDEGKQSRC